MDMTVSQRLSKLGRKQTLAGAYVILLTEIYRCAPELCPTTNAQGSEINRSSEQQVSFAAETGTHSNIPEAHCPRAGTRGTRYASKGSPLSPALHLESRAGVRSCFLALQEQQLCLNLALRSNCPSGHTHKPVTNLALSSYHLGHLPGIFSP